jgi:hypothetical protein
VLRSSPTTPKPSNVPSTPPHYVCLPFDADNDEGVTGDRIVDRVYRGLKLLLPRVVVTLAENSVVKGAVNRLLIQKLIDVIKTSVERNGYAIGSGGVA